MANEAFSSETTDSKVSTAENISPTTAFLIQEDTSCDVNNDNEEALKIITSRTLTPPDRQLQNQQQRQQRPNHELTQEERIAKRNLKKQLKQLTRLRKYETRLKQAMDRNDTRTEDRARKELQQYCQELAADPQGREVLSSSPLLAIQRQQQIEPFQESCRQWIMSIYQSFILLCQDRLKESSSSIPPNRDHEQPQQTEEKVIQASVPITGIAAKQFQTDQARHLLQNMTKGTQTESMFDNSNALLGYTRQKFIERAMLVVSSLDKLNLKEITPSLSSCDASSASSSSETNNFSNSTKRLRDRLLTVQNVCSIGCGPGCDAIGVMAFLELQNRNNIQEQYPHRQPQGKQHVTLPKNKLHRIILMDYVMPQWKHFILEPLVEVLVPNHVPEIDMVACDIRESLLQSDSNWMALKELKRQGGQHKYDESATDIIQASISTRSMTDTDPNIIVLVSYVLTETRGKWHTFFLELIQLVPSGTLFYMSEPTAWQLHQFLKLYGDSFFSDYEWLDSSRATPELRSLDGRIGPAVLLACVK